MRFTVERESILSALSFVAKYAATKDTIPILSIVLVEADAGRVTLTATDMDRVASDGFAADIKIGGAVCLPADLLLKSIKIASGSEVAVASDDRQATVACGQSKFKLPVLLASDFPAMGMLANEAPCNFQIPADTLHRVYSKVGFAMSKDARTRFYLCGISWVVAAGILEFCATDGKQLSLLSVPAPVSSIPHVIVPEFDIPAWEGEVSVSVSDLFIRLGCAGQTLASKLIDGTFPEYHRVIPKNETSILFDRAEMLSAVTRATLVADAREHSILFAGKAGKITVSSRTLRGEVSDKVAYDGDDFRIAVASGAITPIFKSFDCETIEWRIADAGSPVTVHDPKDASRVTVVMPYRDSRVTQEASDEQQEAA